MSNLKVSYPIVCTISGGRDSWDSSLYRCKLISPYHAVVFARYLLKTKFLYALVDLEVLLVKSGANTLCRHKEAVQRIAL